MLELTRLIRARIGALYKVLPTALFAAAMRPSITRRDLEKRIDRLIEELAAQARQPRRDQRAPGRRGSGRAARDARHRRARARPLPRPRPHRAPLLRADAIEHLLVDAPGRTASSRTSRSMLDQAAPRLSSISSRAARSCKKLASRYGMRKPTSFARRFIAGETVEEAIDAARAVEAAGLLHTLDYLGESVTSLAEADSRDARVPASRSTRSSSPASSATSR